MISATVVQFEVDVQAISSIGHCCTKHAFGSNGEREYAGAFHDSVC